MRINSVSNATISCYWAKREISESSVLVVIREKCGKFWHSFIIVVFQQEDLTRKWDIAIPFI